MKRMIFLFIAFLLYAVCWAVNFKQVAYIDKGRRQGLGFVKVYDTNHNGGKEIIFRSLEGVSGPANVYTYEYNGSNTYLLGDTIWAGSPYPWPWAVGETDNDGLTDLEMQNVSISNNIYESVAYNSYPKQIVWSYNTTTTSVDRTYYADLDRDGKMDILTENIAAESLFIFENNGNNNYNLVWTTNLTGVYGDWCVSTFAIGDFDGDSLNEFVTSGIWSRIILFECNGDNQYQIVWNDSIIARASYDNITLNDLDGDNKPEFVIGSSYNSGFNWMAKWSFFKSTGDNQYAKFYEDSLYDNHGLGDYYSASYSGDIDGDGKTEAVLARNNNWQVYKWQNSQVENIYKAYATDNGRDNTSLTVADMNGNGYDEIIESGSITDSTSETKIWEIMGEVIWDSLTAISKDSCIQVDWSTIKQFANYGFNLWRAVGADSNYSMIHETNDTIRLDTALLSYTFNDSNVTTGTTYYYKVQAKALNDSSIYFGPVNALGVEGRPGDRIPNIVFRMYQNSPNPFSHSTTIRYQTPSAQNMSLKIYNVAGQLVKTLVDNPSPNSFGEGQGVRSVTWDGRDESNQPVSNGIYFYQLQAGDKQATKKLIKLK